MGPIGGGRAHAAVSRPGGRASRRPTCRRPRSARTPRPAGGGGRTSRPGHLVPRGRRQEGLRGGRPGGRDTCYRGGEGKVQVSVCVVGGGGGTVIFQLLSLWDASWCKPLCVRFCVIHFTMHSTSRPIKTYYMECMHMLIYMYI